MRYYARVQNRLKTNSARNYFPNNDKLNVSIAEYIFKLSINLEHEIYDPWPRIHRRRGVAG